MGEEGGDVPDRIDALQDMVGRGQPAQVYKVVRFDACEGGGELRVVALVRVRVRVRVGVGVGVGLGLGFGLGFRLGLGLGLGLELRLVALFNVLDVGLGEGGRHLPGRPVLGRRLVGVG